jgi:hypothetical protein
MARLAVTIPDDLLKLARQAAVKADVPLSAVVELAIRHFVSTAGVAPSKLVWPKPIKSSRVLTSKELCDAINEGRE